MVARIDGMGPLGYRFADRLHRDRPEHELPELVGLGPYPASILRVQIDRGGRKFGAVCLTEAGIESQEDERAELVVRRLHQLAALGSAVDRLAVGQGVLLAVGADR